MKEEVLSFLDPRPGDVVVDATFGGGGHSAEILKRITPGGILVAIDRDVEALERAEKIFGEGIKNVVTVKGNFRDIADILKERGIGKIDGAVFDLGFSSYQIDEAARGFSYTLEGPLDMRFDRAGGITARDIVNTFSEEDIRELIRDYGEERHYRLIASAIVAGRKEARIETTGQLSGIVEKAVGRWYSKQRIHPACRTFQALRIKVNDELSAAEQGLEGAISVLAPGRRICAISFHSLEDRVVKTVFKKEAKFGTLKMLAKKPIIPCEDEVKTNPRSRSAKLRVAERIK